VLFDEYIGVVIEKKIVRYEPRGGDNQEGYVR
jgi:hypothetical protein